MRIRYALFFAFVFIVSCNNSYVPSGVIKPQLMQDIFWDVIRGDILAQEIVKKDSTKNINNESFVITEKIFSIHHINRREFEKSMAFYEKHPELLKIIFDSLNAKQGRKSPMSEMERRKNIFEINKRKAEENNSNFPTHIIKTK